MEIFAKGDDNHDIIDLESNVLKVKTEIFCGESHEKFKIRMPRSRINRKGFKVEEIEHQYKGFKKRIQDTYNTSPVGCYEGPYDQNSLISLSAQLPKSKLNFKDYTSFLHPQKSQCKRFDIMDHYEDINDLQKIESLNIIEDSYEAFVRL